MPRWTSALKRVFRKGHPDIYEAFKDYCDKKGIDTDDAAAAAVSAYLAADEEGKKVLEETLAQRKGSKGGVDIAGTVALITSVADSMGKMFEAVNTVRSQLSVTQLVNDYKTLTNAASEIKKLGSESGSGSTEDFVAKLILGRLFGGTGEDVGKLLGSKGSGKKTGSGAVTEVTPE